jgi:serine/threonine-protein kinase
MTWRRFVLGETVSPDRILEKLGQGGMGEVITAQEMRRGGNVALEFLPEALCSDTGARPRFEREARTIAAPDYPQSVQCLGRILGLT